MANVLDGVRVIDFSMFAFGPSAGAVLADWGADVVRVMHPKYPDPLQTAGTPVPLPPKRVDAAFLWEIVNRGKRSIGIDGRPPEGREPFPIEPAVMRRGMEAALRAAEAMAARGLMAPQ